MKMKYWLSTGLLVQASYSTAWVLDETVSTPPSNPVAATDPIKQDLFEPPEKSNLEDNDSLLSSFNLSELLSTPDPEPTGSNIKPPVTEIAAIPELPPKLPHLEKKIASLSPQDIANNKYNAALQKIELQENEAAEALFTEILRDYPPHTLSRVQLSKLAMLKNDYEKAEKWLTEHPDYFSKHPAYLQTLAMVYERTGRKQEALKILDQVPTEHRKNVEFYSLLASLYQQTGNHVLAQRYYNGLLNREPNNMTWLLGLSISLDSGGEKKMAAAHYKKILERGGIDPKVLSFVKSRVEQLSKR